MTWLFDKIKELEAYIRKIKNDFDSKKTTTKSPLEIFGEKLEKAKNPKSERILPIDNIKKAIADAIYIYDFYKYIEEKDITKQFNVDEIL